MNIPLCRFFRQLRRHNKTIHTAPAGVISLIALILMATITATAVGASVLILNELRQSESIDQSYAAIYASESGLEGALHIISLGRANGSSFADTKSALRKTGTLNGQSGWTWARTVQEEDEFRVTQMRQDQAVTLDYANPDSATGASGIDYIKVDWNEDCDGHTQLETSLLKWQTNDDGTINFDPAQQQVYKRLDACNISSHRCTELTIDTMISADQASFQLQKTEPYRFVFRPVGVAGDELYTNCSVKDLQVTGYEKNLDGGADTLIPIPSRLTVKSVGGYGRSLQALSASIAWKAPASALFNYVVFSEEDVEK